LQKPLFHNKTVNNDNSYFVDLLRHGEVEGGCVFRGWIDQPLSDRGLSEMHLACAPLSQIDYIASSPLIRCLHFAGKLAAARSCPLKTYEAFKEIHFGEWEGLSASEIQNNDKHALEKFWHDPEKNPPPGGETLSQFYNRVALGWHDFILNNNSRNALIIAHGGSIRAIICEALNLPLSALNKLEIPKGSLSRIRISADEEKLYCSLVFMSFLPEG
jgi:broad specificity phosphatase PhoE